MSPKTRRELFRATAGLALVAALPAAAADAREAEWLRLRAAAQADPDDDAAYHALRDFEQRALQDAPASRGDLLLQARIVERWYDECVLPAMWGGEMLMRNLLRFAAL